MPCSGLPQQPLHLILSQKAAASLPAGWKHRGVPAGVTSQLCTKLQAAACFQTKSKQTCNARTCSCFGLVPERLCQLFLWP